MTMESIADVQYQIRKGTFDADLQLLAETIRVREKELKANLLYSLKAGDHVRLANLSPVALNGHVGVVVKVNRTTVSVELGEETEASGFLKVPARYHGISRIPVGALTKVEV